MQFVNGMPLLDAQQRVLNEKLAKNIQVSIVDNASNRINALSSA